MNYQQHDPPHPEELIQRTYIEPFEGITSNGIADRLGVARSTFNRLLNGKSGISPEMAVRLSEVLGSSAEAGWRYKKVLTFIRCDRRSTRVR